MTHQDDDVPSPSTVAPIVKRVKLLGLVCGGAAVAAAAIIGSGTQLATSPIANAGPAPTKPTATVSGAADYKTGYDWFAQNLTKPYQAMDSALKTFGDGVSNSNDSEIQDGCQQLQVASAMYQQALPGPDSRATARLSMMADKLNEAAADCRHLPPGAGWNDVKVMMTKVDEARTRLREAQRILQPYN